MSGHAGDFPATAARLGTITRSAAVAQPWDAIVLGAGLAGTLAARGLALAGRRVLLVEAKAFPRDKVCGGCLNPRAQRLLIEQGLREALRRSRPIPLPRLHLACPGRASTWTLEQPLLSIRRSTLDEALVDAAVTAGAEFLPSTFARVMAAQPGGASRAILLRPRAVSAGQPSSLDTGDETLFAHAQLVVCSDGLHHPSLAELPEFRSCIREDSRVGVQATLAGADSATAPGQLTMVVGGDGYVGMAPVSPGALHVAAAVDPRRLSGGVRPAELVASILAEAGHACPRGLHDATWLGTGPLTRHSGAVAGHRLLLAGDAVGYIEPFTGEGMSWALASAVALVPRALEAIDAWNDEIPSLWQRDLHMAVGRHQWACRVLSRLLRRPRWARAALRCCDALPVVRRQLLRHTSGSQRWTPQGNLP